jgi:predicted ribosomally synthesized peptide with nif11-like leader
MIMDQNKIQKFIKALNEDQSLRRKLDQKGSNIVDVARMAGYEISQADLVRHISENVSTLSDQDLESTAFSRMPNDLMYPTFTPNSACPACV